MPCKAFLVHKNGKACHRLRWTRSGKWSWRAIASEAIRLHGGKISARNLFPTGLEIRIQLPIAHDAGMRGYGLSRSEQSAAI